MEYIWLSRSEISEKEKKKINEVLDAGYLGMGKYVGEFEEKLKEYLGGKNVVCVNTGTSALHLALEALRLPKGSEVLVQSLTYVATFQAITAAGLKPIPVEIYPETCTIDLEDAAKKITEKTRVIMPVHYASRCGDLDKIYIFAKKYNLRVVEDAAHAFGSLYKGKKIGSFGDIVCFSFDPIKNITCGEGGAIVSADEEVIQYVKDARLLGVQKDSDKRYQSQRSWIFDVSHQGYRYHMNNISAAIGIAQLERFETEFKPKRQELAKQYYKLLNETDDIILFPNDFDEIVPHIFPIRILNGKRDFIKQKLAENNIDTGIHYYPN
ncbi:MAG TPA: DegT/DnrJ/EryC1/StrS family aminotransferase, partial [bacterium]|nr:DegT/DnrJ/EryC1/StrS family aminotransferase [bacterium]